jgi:hypothetical protein
MPTTTNLGLRYPAGTDGVDVVRDVQNLATDVDTVLYPKTPILARQTLAGSASSVTFSSISTALRSVRLRVSARGDAAVVSQNLLLRVNGDTGSNYTYQYVQGSATTASAGATFATTSLLAGLLPGASATANVFGSAIIDVLPWDSPHTQYLEMQFSSTVVPTGTTTDFNTRHGGGIYSPAGPYTSLTLLPGSGGNFVIGSDFQLEAWPS